MDELIIRSLHGRASDREERQLAEWRASSPERDRHYREVVRIWELGGILDSDVPGEAAPTVEQLLRRAPRVVPSVRRPPRWLRHPWMRRGAAIAAVLVVGLGLGRLLAGGPKAPPFGAAEFVTGPAETVTVRLGDGTIVRLAPESRLRLTGEREREVWLDGHAYFAVAKQEGHSFRVRTHAGTALVLGTRFDLQARDDRLRLLVVEGKVELAARGRTVELVASEAADLSGGGALATDRVDEGAVRERLRWMGNFVAFEATPLEQAARELSLHYGVPIEVLDSALARETVQGWFADEELEVVIKMICRAVNAHCSVLPSGVTIAP